MEIPYINQSVEMQRKISALEEENARLRNTVISSNDEIFTLKAVSVSFEAELKYSTEIELAKMGSELKFRSKELENLSRDHERLLKELAHFKQQEAANKKLTHSETNLNKGRDCVISSTVRSQQDGSSVPVPEGDLTVGSMSPPISRSQIIPHSTSGAKLATAVDTEVVSLVRDNRPVGRVGTTAVNTVNAVNTAAMLPTSSSFPQNYTHQVPTSVKSNSLDSRVLEISTSFQTFLSNAAMENLVRLSATVSHSLTKAGYILASLQIESQSNEIIAILSDLFSVLRHFSTTGGEEQRSGSNTVVGSLQGKFDQVATTTTHSSTTAASARPALSFDNTKKDQYLDEQSELILRAVNTPMLPTNAVTNMLTNRNTSNKYANAVYHHSYEDVSAILTTYSSVVEKVACYCIIHVDTAKNRVDVDLVAHTASACKMLIKTLQKRIDLEVRGDSGADVVTCSSLEDIEAKMLSLSIELIDRAGKSWFLCQSQCRLQLLHLWSAVAISPDRSWKYLSLSGKPASNRGSHYYTVLEDLVDVVSAPVYHVDGCNITYRCEVVRALITVLEASGGAFVRRLLGLVDNPKRWQKSVDSDEDTDRNDDKRRNSRSNAGNSNDRKRVLQESVQSTITPTHPRKTQRLSGRAEHSLSAIDNSSSVGGGEHSAVRITPSGPSSVQRSGGRRACPVSSVIDLGESITLIKRNSINKLSQVWMELIRYLDDSNPVSEFRRPSTVESAMVRLVHLLGSFLSAVTDHLRPQDCEVVLSECANVLHEFIYRCNTSSWNPLLRISDSLFGFLEARQYEST